MPTPSAVSSTHLENWPPALARLSVPHRPVELADDDARALVAQEPALRHLVGATGRLAFSAILRRSLDEAVAAFSEGVFLRLGACSFVTARHGPTRVRTGEEALRVLMHPGLRAAAMACRCRLGRRPVVLFVRAWRDIPPWSEFRLFFRGRVLVGATQYHHRLSFDKIAPYVDAIVGALGRIVEPLAAALPTEDAVADVQLVTTAAGFEAVLIETNPFLPTTGPGLFTWADGTDFDGTLRFRRPDGTVEHIPLRNAVKSAGVASAVDVHTWRMCARGPHHL
jgi:hypothetical protein